MIVPFFTAIVTLSKNGAKGIELSDYFTSTEKAVGQVAAKGIVAVMQGLTYVKVEILGADQAL